MFLEYIEFLNKKISKSRKGSKLIGIELKKLRLSRNLTLNEVCKGICCSSYLSKMENNLIDGSRTYVSDLFEKLQGDCDFSIIDPAKYDKIIRAAIVADFYKRVDILEAISKYTKNREMAYYLDLLNLILGVANDNTDRAYVAARQIIKYKDSLEPDDVIIVTMYMGIMYFKDQKYLEAYRLLNKLDCSALDEILSCTVEMYKFKLGFILKRMFNMNELYNVICNKLIKLANTERLVDIRKTYLFMTIVTKNRREADEMIKYGGRLGITRAFYDLVFENGINVRKILSVEAKKVHYYIYMILYHSMNNNRFDLEKLINEDMPKSHSKSVNRFFDFHRFIWNKSHKIEDKINYLREVILSEVYSTNNLYEIDYYTKYLFDFLFEIAHYKECCTLTRKKESIIRKITDVADNC